MAKKYRAQRTQSRKAEGPGANQKKQMAGEAAVFPSGYVVALVAVLEQPAESRRGRKAEGARKAHNSIRTRLKSIFWCWQYKLSYKAERRLKRRKTALKRKAEKAEDGKRRKAGSGKQKSRKSRKRRKSRK